MSSDRIIASTPALCAIRDAIRQTGGTSVGKVYATDIRAAYSAMQDPMRMTNAAFGKYTGELLFEYKGREGTNKKTYYKISEDILRELVISRGINLADDVKEATAVYSYIKNLGIVKNNRISISDSAINMLINYYTIIILIESNDKETQFKRMMKQVDYTCGKTFCIHYDPSGYPARQDKRYEHIIDAINEIMAAEGERDFDVAGIPNHLSEIKVSSRLGVGQITPVVDYEMTYYVVRTIPLRYHIHDYKKTHDPAHILEWNEYNSDKDNLIEILETGDADLIATFMEARYGELFRKNGMVIEM